MHTHDLLTLAAAIVPERTATVFGGRRMSYAELAARANRLANALADAGVGAGDRIAVADVNTPSHLELYFAAARLDAIYVPLNFRSGSGELANPVQQAAPKALFAGSRYMPVIEEVRSQTPSVEIFVAMGAPTGGPSGVVETPPGWRSYDVLLEAGGEDELRFPEGGDEDTAVLLFTAGTTGHPKAVVLTQASFTSYMLTSVEPPDPDVEERTLLTLPMHHIAGLQAALASVYGGRTLIIQRQFEPREWMEVVEHERVQRVLLVPTMLKQLIDHPDFGAHDLTSLQVLTYGGASMPPSLIERAIPAFPGVQFINAFGQTETGSTIAMVPPEDHVLQGSPEMVARRRKRLSSIGVPLPDVEVRIVDDNGETRPIGATGEIIARGPRLMRGYWGQEEATAETLQEGWVYTGDLGYQDEDGYIYLQGRAKDFIKRGGEMVSPEEVENVLHAHEGVDEAAVIGLPDETWGERVVAVVVPRGGVEVTDEALLDLCHEHLARFKRPEQVLFVDALPRNALGKVLKWELRERFGA